MPKRRHEWVETIPNLTLAERRQLRLRIYWKLFNYRLLNLRKFYRFTAHLHALKNAFASIRPVTGIAIQAGLLSLTILHIMPTHPLSIIVAFGGGLSAALTIHSLSKLLQKVTP